MEKADFKNKSKVFSLNYFNRVGKIEFCRLIFAAAGVQFEDNMIENLSDSGKNSTNLFEFKLEVIQKI